MNLIAIVLCLAAFGAWRRGRLKLVLTPEQAQLIRHEWWTAAKAELKVWAIFAAVVAILGSPLWPKASPATLAICVGISLLLFSRLAIWATLALTAAGYISLTVATVIGHPFCQPACVMIPAAACFVAILFRAPLGLFYAKQTVPH
jgi:hypothetical protein